jgi:hypothetical protein
VGRHKPHRTQALNTESGGTSLPENPTCESSITELRFDAAPKSTVQPPQVAVSIESLIKL